MSFVIRRSSGGGEIATKSLDTDELLGRLPGLAVREMDVVLGMLLIG
jgi:hypothetical protein